MVHCLLPDTAQHKANLHCHTDYSDGVYTPEKIKEIYTSHGYDIVAFTDHEYIVNHQNLADAHFIPLTGYEMSVACLKPDEHEDWRYLKCAHLNLYAKNPDEEYHVCFNPDYVPYEKAKPIRNSLKYHGERFAKRYDLQYIIDRANAHGFLIGLNHPYWSRMPHEDYFGLRGLFALEVYNTGAERINGTGEAWSDYGMLVDVNPDVAPTASDDNHNHGGLRDSFGGFTMICTDDFTYSGVIRALGNRDFYASTGVLIKSLYIEDGILHASFTECTDISVNFAARFAHSLYEPDGMTEFAVAVPEGARYIRLDLRNHKDGTRAMTRAFAIE